ncbi:MAG: hypothetical protein KIC80_07645 [Brachyspira sp.]|jgi:hypothetical protein|nr:hypothetical protein [Brachyspira sp.]
MTLDDGMSIAIIFVFLIGFILIFVLIITIFKDSLYVCLPLEYDKIKETYGQPQISKKVYITFIGGFRTRGFWGNLDIYQDKIVLSIFNRAIAVTDPQSLQYSKVWENLSIVVEEKSKITISLSKKDYQLLQSIYQEKQNV